MTYSSWLAPETPDLVWFRGADTIRFLNDLLSQEIGTMQPGRVTRSLLLAPQGKLDHSRGVRRGDEEIGLITDGGRGEDLAATLGRYRIRVDVEVEQSEQPAWIVVGQVRVEPGTWSRINGGLEVDVSWPGIERTLVVGDRPDLEEGDAGEYESLRIAAGEPRWGVDVDEKTIPQESGLVGSTVDFTKGCYLGQEIVARIHYRGGVHRGLQSLRLEGEVAVGDTLMAGDREVGHVTSMALDGAGEPIALGIVGNELAAAGTTLTTVAGGRVSVR